MRTRLLLCALLGAAFLAQPSTGWTQPGRKGEFPGSKGGKGPPAKAGDLKKYDDVITKDFTTQTGVFAVHRHDEKVYFEIPQDKLGRLFLWHAEVAKGPGGSSWGGAEIGHAVLKFERRGNKIYLWKVGFAKRSDGKAMQSAVEAAATDSIIASYIDRVRGQGPVRGHQYVRRGRQWFSRSADLAGGRRRRGKRRYVALVPRPRSRRSRPTSRRGRSSPSAAAAGAARTFRAASRRGRRRLAERDTASFTRASPSCPKRR